MTYLIECNYSMQPTAIVIYPCLVISYHCCLLYYMQWLWPHDSKESLQAIRPWKYNSVAQLCWPSDIFSKIFIAFVLFNIQYMQLKFYSKLLCSLTQCKYKYVTFNRLCIFFLSNLFIRHHNEELRDIF